MKDEKKSREELIDELNLRRRQSYEYAAILNVLPDIVYKIDPDGIFTYLSDSINTLGYTPDELIGKHFSEIVQPGDVASISRATVLPKYKGKITGSKNSPRLFDERRTGKRVTKNLIFRLMPNKKEMQDAMKNGSSDEFFAEVMASGYYERDQNTGKRKFLGTVGIIRNITERMQLIDEKAKLENQLFQSQKMEALGQLAGGIAHDYNNILGAVSGYADIIGRRFGPDIPILKKYTDTILSAATRAADLTEKLLNFARKGSNQRILIDAHSVISDAIQLLKHTIDSEIKIIQELNAKNANMLAEPNQIQNAVINIALNAQDAMSEGGKLIFRTENVFLPNELQVTQRKGLTRGTYLVLSITDTGTGMSKEVKARIFEPFFTTKGIGKGTGLGLASVYGIIEGHNGIIDVKSAPGEGTTFILYLSLKAKQISDKTTDSKKSPKDSQRKEHALVINDEKLMLEICTEILKGLGYSVSTCNNGIEAVNFYKNHYEEIDLVVIDMIMPEINGRECFQHLKEINPKIVAILSTYYAPDENTKVILAEGVSGLIQKPFVRKKLSQTISHVLDGK